MPAANELLFVGALLFLAAVLVSAAITGAIDKAGMMLHPTPSNAKRS